MQAVNCFLKGFRTLLAALMFVVVGLFGVLGALDLSPLVALFTDDPKILAAVMVGVGVLFGLLRTLSSTPVMQSHRQRHLYNPEKPGQGGDDVDTDEPPESGTDDVPLKSNIEAGE